MTKNNSRVIISEKIKEGMTIHYKRTLIGILLLIFCFLPVILDMISDGIPYALFEEDMLNIGEKAFCTADTGEIKKTNIVVQTFKCQMSTVSSIELKACLYDVNHGEGLLIRLVDDMTGVAVEEWEADASDIGRDASLSLKCKRPLTHLNMKGKVYSLIIVPKDIYKRSGIGLYKLTTNSYKDGCLIEDNRDTGNDLLMKISGYNGIVNMERVNIWLSIYKTAVIAGVLFGVRSYEARKQKNRSN